MFQEAVALADEISPDGQLLLIQNRQDFSMMSNFSKTLMQQMMPLVNNNFPERIYKVCMVNCELMFNVLFKIVSPFLDARQKSKINNIYQQDLL